MTSQDLLKRINASLAQQAAQGSGRYEIGLDHRDGRTLYWRATGAPGPQVTPSLPLGSVALPALRDLAVDYQGDFTFVQVTGEDGTIGRGYAKRNARLVRGRPLDPYRAEIGRRVALRRAMEQYRGRVVARAAQRLMQEYEQRLNPQEPSVMTRVLQHEFATGGSLAACAKSPEQGSAALSSVDSGAREQRMVGPTQSGAAASTGDT